MPFRNPITTLGGILSVPALQSPDYSRTDIPFNIDGWKLDNDPSSINVGDLHAEQLYISSDVPGSPNAQEINVTQFLGTGPDHQYFRPVNVMNLTTSYQGYGKLTDPYVALTVPPQCVGANSPAMCHWEIHTSFDVRSVSATTHGVLCTIAISYTSFDPWQFPYTGNGTVAYVKQTANLQADTVSTLHIIGSENNPKIDNPFYTLPAGTTRVNVSPAARATVVSTANLNLASTYMHIIRSPLYARLS